MRFRLMAGTVFSTVTLALGGGMAFAQSAPAVETDAPPSGERDQVTVTATRVEQSIDEVPATVTVITAEKIEDELVTDIKDLTRFEPGVSVRASPARFGAALGATGRDRNSGFNIRGLEGNRVLVQTDGVRIPDGYAFGPTVNGRGDYVDLDLLKSVEFIRGPASALYGSDGVAGAVTFITRDPDDIVQDGRSFGIRARSSYASADDSIANSLIGATTLGDWSAMLAYTRRDAHETENQGEIEAPDTRRTAANPTDYESDAYLGKIVWAPGDMHRFRLTFDQLESQTDTDVLSGQYWLPANGNPNLTIPGTAVLALTAQDTLKRTRYTFDHQMKFGEGFLRSAQWAIYSQQSDTRQFTAEDRNTSVDRTRDNYFNNDVWGANGQIEAAFDTGWARHRLLVGADYSELEQEGIRSGTVPTPPDTFPARAFPTTEYTLTGIFAQDQITLLDGALMLYPALRYDAYELTPKPDALFPTTVATAPSDDSHISPKFGIVAWPADWFGAFFNYAAGYKAPEPSQVNNAFSNLAFGYTSIPNPDLKPESSNSTEIGIRLRDINLLGAQWSGEIVGFAADYKDFISQQVVSGSFTPTNPAVYQYVNFTDVSVNGVEMKANAVWNNGFGLRFAASQADGEVRGAVGSPLESIDPAKLVAGVTYDDSSGVFGGQIIATFVDGKQLQDVTSSTLFRPPSFSLLDITAYWNITDWAALRVGAFNVTDEKYWWWGDVRGVAATSTTLDAYTQPGANYSASLTFRY
ncbi:MAG: TonB-dependent hemoglobin/transferrin/lactoferrin family receptor [Hyphomonadaceae bacterium]